MKNMICSHLKTKKNNKNKKDKKEREDKKDKKDKKNKKKYSIEKTSMLFAEDEKPERIELFAEFADPKTFVVEDDPKNVKKNEINIEINKKHSYNRLKKI